MKLWQRWRKTSLPNKLAIILSALAVIISGFNLWMLKQQNEGQDRQVGQIRSAITNGIGQAKAAIDGTLAQNNSAIKAILEENRIALDASHAESGKALGATINGSQNDLRAWIGPRAGTYKVKVKLGARITQEYEIINYGKTPALNVRTAVGTSVVLNGQEPAKDFACPPMNDESVSKPATMFPGGVRVLAESPKDLIVGNQMFSQTQNGATRIVMFGCVWYNDIFSEKLHRTTFCTVTDGTSQGAESCGVHNEAD